MANPDDPFDDDWEVVYPNSGGSFLVCPECAAVVPDTSVGDQAYDGRMVHYVWHKTLRRNLANGEGQ